MLHMKLAYFFALVGSPALKDAAMHLTAIHILKKTNPMYDIVSMQTSNNFVKMDSLLNALNVKKIIVNSIAGRCQRNSDHNKFRFSFSYSIIRIWEQYQYDKIIYIDSDLAVMKNMDSVFYEWSLQNTMELRTPTGCNKYPNTLYYNTGVWGVTPSRKFFSHFENWFQTADYPCGLGFQTWARIHNENNSFSKLPIVWNMKGDQGITRCLRRHKEKRPFIVHWSGNRKPIHLMTYDSHEKKALVLYKEVFEKYMSVLV